MRGADGLAYTCQGDGPPLVLIHGVGHDRSAWNPVCHRLAAHHEIIAVDLPGHGTSPGLPMGSGYTVASLTCAVRRLITGLNLQRPHVAGNSLGASIALELARAGCVRSATALAPIGFWTTGQVRYVIVSLHVARLLARLAHPLAPALVRPAFVRAVLLAQYYGHPGRLTTADARAAIDAFAGSVALPATLPNMRHYRFDPAPGIGLPVTIARGTRDHLLTPRQAQRARATVPQARHVWLPGCGHVPMSDDPERVAAVILDTSGIASHPYGPPAAPARKVDRRGRRAGAGAAVSGAAR